MKLGFNLLLWSASVGEHLYPVVEELKNIGYDGIEYAVAEPNAAVYKKFGEFLRSQEMKANTVLALSPEENISSSEESVRKRGVEKIKWVIDRAHETESEIICGPFHSAFAHFTREAPQKKEYQYSAESLNIAGEYAKQAGITLALEALNRFECYLCNTMQQLNELIAITNHSNVRAMFDTHHANIEEKSITKALQEIAPNLRHVHLSENDRGTPGQGHIPWGDVFQTLKELNYDGWITVEAFSRKDPDFANAINVWRQYSPDEEIYKEGFRFLDLLRQQYTSL